MTMHPLTTNRRAAALLWAGLILNTIPTLLALSWVTITFQEPFTGSEIVDRIVSLQTAIFAVLYLGLRYACRPLFNMAWEEVPGAHGIWYLADDRERYREFNKLTPAHWITVLFRPVVTLATGLVAIAQTGPEGASAAVIATYGYFVCLTEVWHISWSLPEEMSLPSWQPVRIVFMGVRALSWAVLTTVASIVTHASFWAILVTAAVLAVFGLAFGGLSTQVRRLVKRS
ncbi:hypothetical protein [Arthrobacter sp. RCC_34]|uniref:hypothetical protein n=1 Tax=Arthrobacter sp. RCC_34 TaxID=3239230 RepID=UPI003525CEFC